MNQPRLRPIIIIKKKAGHGGHHGGAWKVAYADFVTAMMALFIVLWLLNYQRAGPQSRSAHISRIPPEPASNAGSASAGTGETVSVDKDNMDKLKDQLEQALKKSPEFEKLKNYVQMSVTGEGLAHRAAGKRQGNVFSSPAVRSPTGMPVRNC